MKIKMLLVTGTLFASLAFSASYTDADGNIWQYQIKNGVAALDQFNGFKSSGKTTDIVIPSTLGGAPVKNIPAGSGLFKQNKTITSVVLPDGLTSISGDAFTSCSALTNVTPFLPATVTSIGNYAFTGCPFKQTLVFSGSTIGGYSFQNTKLTDFDLSASTITSIPKSTFKGITLARAIFPATLTALNDSCIGTLNNKTQLYFLGAKAPTINDNFTITKVSPLRIYVLKSAIDGWKESLGTSWKDMTASNLSTFYKTHPDTSVVPVATWSMRGGATGFIIPWSPEPEKPAGSLVLIF